MKKKIMLWRPLWLLITMLWLGGPGWQAEAAAQESGAEVKSADAIRAAAKWSRPQENGAETWMRAHMAAPADTSNPLRIAAPDLTPISMPASDVKRLLGKARKSGVCDTVRVKLSDYVYGDDIPIYLILVGEGEGTIDWGDGTQSACVAVEEADYYYWVAYRHTYAEAGGYELTIYTSSPEVRIIGVQLASYADYTNYQLVKSIDLRANPSLKWLYCTKNQLTSLDLSKNPALWHLNCSYNRLTSLDLSENVALGKLNCSYNQLTFLDVSKCVHLWGDYDEMGLNCSYNQLTSLDLSNNTALRQLDCSYNRLTSLDVSKNVDLVSLNCSNNRLTALDVSKNMKLEYLFCNDNALTSIKVMEKPEDLSIIYGYSGFDARNNRLGWAALAALSEMYGQIYLSPQQQTADLTLDGTLDLSGYMTYEGQQTVCDFSQMPGSAYEWTDGRLKIRQVGVYNFSMYNPAVRIKNGDSVVINWTLTVYPSERDTVRWTWKVAAERINTCYLNAFGDSTLVVNWGDGQDTVLEVLSGNGADWPGVSHAYAEAGKYEVTVYGNSARYMLTGLGFSQRPISFDSLSVCGANLSSLNCSHCNLSMLEVSQCVNLTSLDCSSNSLDTLDVSACVKLWSLDCSYNELKFLDVSGCEALCGSGYTYYGVGLDCSNNHLTSLDLSKNTALLTLDCSNNGLPSLDISQNTALTSLACSNNQLTSMDVSQNTALTSLACSNNGLPSLDISQNTALTSLDCSNNRLTSLDVSNNTALEDLDCSNNQLTALDVSHCITLGQGTENWRGLNCSNNQLTSLDVSQNTSLGALYCINNQLTSLDVSQNTSLRWLYCSHNQLTALDVSKNAALLELGCNNNQLTSLDVLQNTALMELDCSNNQLSALDVSQCVALRGSAYGSGVGLNCSNNHLTSLDVSQNVKLVSLDCSDNQLGSLDVSQNVNLVSLDCSDNQLDSLDLESNTNLRYLYCDNNRLTSLAISPNANRWDGWYRLSCTHNRLPFENVAALSAIMQSAYDAYEYRFYPQQWVIQSDWRQGLDWTTLVPTVGGTSADFKWYNGGGAELAEGSGYTVDGDKLYFDQSGTYYLSLTHEAVTERFYENYENKTRLYKATCAIHAAVCDTLRMTWTAEAGETKGFSFEGTAGGCYVVHWGDGDTVRLIPKGKDVTMRHVYAVAGVYEVQVCGLSVEHDGYVEDVLDMVLPMVYVQGGTFQMGATSEQGSVVYDSEKPVHSVTLSDFYIGQFEVTQAQWEAVMGTNPCSSSDGLGDDYPVYNVSWTEAQEFCRKLSLATGKTYRLPTESEWEYAARGGQVSDSTKYAGSNAIDEVAWYGDDSGSAHSVGRKAPNGLGLYDMSGNVWEWCQDWYGSYGSSSVTNPQGPSTGSNRVIRGGSWYFDAQDCRVSNRNSYTPGGRDSNLGFRVVCER